ncbi:aldo/keto reductase [Pyrobaculum neutrophilum]|uniref:Aldo/keto reductase n=1 Tax=Pyrobaculum neutrophilum (strain DSM 2338 / JCM 9278 / NBRC 100436 / V24Sta) TaxID=444157 RepID=B1YBS4_PYRNV|nr:aldo/keto reductase [Pyrobaculum neutrophilum]ACB39308.1 aldo/keto reductase [Pyrobaculum neutrophilum V24Sta]
MRCSKAGMCVTPLGLGTFGVGGDFWTEDRGRDYEAVTALRRGLELGVGLVDTSELYGRGHAEELVGVAAGGLAGVVIITKLQPTSVTLDEVVKRAEASARRLGRRPTAVAIHWVPPNVSVCDVVKVLEAAVEKGAADYYGLTNVTAGMLKTALVCAKKTQPAFVQNRYSLLHRRDEIDVIPLAKREGLIYMAYSPLERGALALDSYLAQVGQRYGKTAAQVALNWYIKAGIVPIVKAANVEHVEENAGALGWALSDRDWEEINKFYIQYRYVNE